VRVRVVHWIVPSVGTHTANAVLTRKRERRQLRKKEKSNRFTKTLASVTNS
jgi:hypothetical protein